MRNTTQSVVWCGLSLICLGVAFAQQELFFAEPIEEPRPVFDLPLVKPQDAPEVGTFWLYSSSADGAMPPYPFDPYAGLIPMYAMPGLPGQYLIADTSTDYAQLQAISLEMAQLESGGGMMSMSLPEFPGEDDTNGSGGGTWEYTPIFYGSNDFWLEIISGSVTNGTAQLLIHNPVNLTNNPVWDIFATTNLNLDSPGLNATNWTWLLRAAPGQTNVTMPVLSVWQGYCRAGDTNDLDADGLSDLRELWETHSSPSTNDTDGDGLLDAWEWNHFGNFAETDTGDYDNDGTSNLSEQNGGTNPNDLRFAARLADEFVNVTSVAGTVTVSGGVPHDLAVLVNSTNLAAANWLPYTNSFAVPLGPTDGLHTVWVALRGRSADFAPAVDQVVVILDRVVPVLVVTNPVGATVQKPYVQVQGWANEPLVALHYNLSNAFGMVTNVPAAVTDQDFDTNAFDFTTNWFQAYDVPLATNLNHLYLSVTDRAGNVSGTNLWLTLDYTGATNPPSAQLQWPTNGLTMAGTNMTVRGQINDETASISVWWVHGGVTNVWPGVVERSGTFWIDQLPLGAGTNQFILRAEDAAGNVSESSFEMIRGNLNVAVTSTPGGEGLYEPNGNVSGWVSDPAASVSVNGVNATVDELGNWSAANVPLQGDGVSVFDVTVTPPGGSGERLSHIVEKPAAIRVMKHFVKQVLTTSYGENVWTKSYTARDEADGNGLMRHRYQGSASAHWSDIFLPGSGFTDYAWSDTDPIGTWESQDPYGNYSGVLTEADWQVRVVPDERRDYEVEGIYPYVQHFHARGVRHQWEHLTGTVTETVEARTALQLSVGGAQPGRRNLVSVEAHVTAYGRPEEAEWNMTPRTPLHGAEASVDDQALDAQDKVWMILADGAKKQLSVDAGGEKHIEFLGYPGKVNAMLRSVSFQGPGYRSVLKDTNGQGGGYHWESNYVTHVVKDWPALFVSGSKMEAQLTLRGTAATESGVMIVTGEADGYTFLGTNQMDFGLSEDHINVYCATALPANQVNYLNPLTIKWSYVWTNKPNDRIELGETKTPVYVSLRAPASGTKMHRSVVHLACGSPGATDDDEVVASVWSKFVNRDVTTWDGQPLYYYRTAFTFSAACTTVEALLASTNGNAQCGAFMQLLSQAWLVNGVSDWAPAEVNPPSGSDWVVIKSWEFGPTNSNLGDFKWVLQLTAGVNGSPEMVPAENISGTVTNALGIAGQNTSTPAQKIFGRHYLILRDDNLYDPSYGKIYTNALDFTLHSVAGYARSVGVTNGILQLEVRKP